MLVVVRVLTILASANLLLEKFLEETFVESTVAGYWIAEYYTDYGGM